MVESAIRDAIDKVAQAIADNPEKACSKNSATASLLGGLRFSIAGAHGERLETDMPKGVGGGGSAPSPGWAMRAALASCTGSVIAMRAAKQGIELDKLDVTVESGNDLRGMLGLDDSVTAALTGFHMRVAIRARNAEREQLEALVRWSDAHSPVACAMREALLSDIEVVVE